MDIKEVSSNSLSFIGDAVYTLRVREYFVTNKYQSSKDLQKKCNSLNCAKGQMKAFEYLKNHDFFNENELDAYKRGRNHITHIPKNGDLISYYANLSNGFFRVKDFGVAAILVIVCSVCVILVVLYKKQVVDR